MNKYKYIFTFYWEASSYVSNTISKYVYFVIVSKCCLCKVIKRPTVPNRIVINIRVILGYLQSPGPCLLRSKIPLFDPLFR